MSDVTLNGNKLAQVIAYFKHVVCYTKIIDFVCTTAGACKPTQTCANAQNQHESRAQHTTASNSSEWRQDSSNKTQHSTCTLQLFRLGANK